MPTFALNFSRPGAQVVAQYYNFLRLGFEGYRRDPAGLPRHRDVHRGGDRRRSGPFELLSDGTQLPVFFFRLKAEVTNYTVFDVSAKLRERGWQVPAYTLPEPLTDLSRRCASWCATGSAATWPTCSSTTCAGPPSSSRACPARLPADPSHTESFRH